MASERIAVLRVRGYCWFVQLGRNCSAEIVCRLDSKKVSENKSKFHTMSVPVPSAGFSLLNNCTKTAYSITFETGRIGENNYRAIGKIMQRVWKKVLTRSFPLHLFPAARIERTGTGRLAANPAMGYHYFFRAVSPSPRGANG